MPTILECQQQTGLFRGLPPVLTNLSQPFPVLHSLRQEVAKNDGKSVAHKLERIILSRSARCVCGCYRHHGFEGVTDEVGVPKSIALTLTVPERGTSSFFVF